MLPLIHEVEAKLMAQELRIILLLNPMVQLFTCTHPLITIWNHYTITKCIQITYQQFKEESFHTKSHIKVNKID